MLDYEIARDGVMVARLGRDIQLKGGRWRRWPSGDWERVDGPGTTSRDDLLEVIDMLLKPHDEKMEADR